MTGLWDGYMAYSRDDIAEKHNNICSEDSVIRVSDLVDMVDTLYEQEINRSFSPAILLREKGLQNLCSN